MASVLPSKPGPCIVTIFGASGDLAKRKLVPALYNLYCDKQLPEKIAILAVGRKGDHEPFRDAMKEATSKFSRRGAVDEEAWKKFASTIWFHAGTFENPDLYTSLANHIREKEEKWGGKATRIYYLSTPPGMVQQIAEGLTNAGLNEEREKDRLVVEKPFGRDLASAESLNDVLTSKFHESQIYRIDHYLGKETVQNLMAFRFANALYEPVWDRRYIDHVQITVAEEVGVELRGGFYETAGALRDMIQNHLLQLMCMVAMEPPVSFEGDEVRSKKVDVLHAIRPIAPNEVYKYAARGQYGQGYFEGQPVPGYRTEPGVSPESSVETYVALKLFVDNWRWQDVPFYLRTGKRLPTKASQICIVFKPVPHQTFPLSAADHWEPNRLLINIQPKEGIVMRFQAKQPGKGMRLRTVSMQFSYEDAFHTPAAEAYETLLFDVMVGDSTLFMRSDQEQAAWTVLTPVLDAWTNVPSADFPNYAAGSWGPEAGEALIARDGRSWVVPNVPLIGDKV